MTPFDLPRRPALIAFLLAAALMAGCSDEPQKPAPSDHNANRVVDVGTMEMKSNNVPRIIELPGRVAASATTEIRPQVDGIVKKLAFREGRPVKAGDVLYQLDDLKFRAAVDAATASVQKAEATVAGAKDTVTRYEQLTGQNAVSQQEMASARTALLQAEADRASARADLETARINLDNTTIRAPISGIIGTSSISAGALVAANQTTALATIRQVDPVYVDLVDTSVNMLAIRSKLQSGQLGRDEEGAPKVALTLENGDMYDQEGKIEVFDFVVSQTTGTFPIRAVFPNPTRLLLPGVFVRATVDLGTMKGVFLVPQRAVVQNAAGDATANFVTKEGTVDNRVITTDGNIGNDWIVTSGVKEGDLLIVDGLQKISKGSKVKAVPAVMDEDGVVRQTMTEEPKAKTKETAQ